MPIIRNQIIGYTDEHPILTDFFLQQKSAPTLVFVHGFKGFKDWGAWNLMADHFYSRGFNFVKFNLSHNGGTPEQVIDFPDLEAFGNNNFEKELIDIQKVLKRLTESEEFSESIEPDRIALIGHSRGGAMCIISAFEDDRVKALITLNAVVDIHKWMARYDTEEWKRKGVLMTYNGRTGQSMPLYLQFFEEFEKNSTRYDVRDLLTRFSTPALVIHCEDDPVVSSEEAVLFKSIAKNCETYLIKNGGHTLGASHPHISDQLPDSLHMACERIQEYFREQGWIED